MAQVTRDVFIERQQLEEAYCYLSARFLRAQAIKQIQANEEMFESFKTILTDGNGNELLPLTAFQQDTKSHVSLNS